MFNPNPSYYVDQNGRLAPVPDQFSRPTPTTGTSWNVPMYSNPMANNRPIMNNMYDPPYVQQSSQNQQHPSANSVMGRIINDPVDILPKEVPMDGSITVFPLADLSAIYVKAWNAEGRMITVPYAVDPNWKNAETEQEIVSNQEIVRRLEALELTMREPNTQKRTAAKTKTTDNKEGDGNT